MIYFVMREVDCVTTNWRTCPRREEMKKNCNRLAQRLAIQSDMFSLFWRKTNSGWRHPDDIELWRAFKVQGSAKPSNLF